MTSSGLDAYAVVTALPPEPPEDPDPQAAARQAQQALFAAERDGPAWTAPLSPARPGRQRHPATPENRGQADDTSAAERSAMCILGPDGSHASRGLHCPHDLPSGEDDDMITRIEF